MRGKCVILQPPKAVREPKSALYVPWVDVKMTFFLVAVRDVFQPKAIP